MKKYIQLFALSLLVIIAVFYTACQKEENILPSTQIDEQKDITLLSTQIDELADLEQDSSVAPRGLSAFVSLQSFNYPNKYIRHQNSLGYITTISSNLDKLDATFNIVPPLNGVSGCISFQSKNYPGRYLRHEYSRIKLAPYQNTTLYKNDASFRVKPALWNGAYANSFESYNYPNHYIRHRNSELWKDPYQNTDLYKKDASFAIVPPFAN